MGIEENNKFTITNISYIPIFKNVYLECGYNSVYGNGSGIYV